MNFQKMAVLISLFLVLVMLSSCGGSNNSMSTPITSPSSSSTTLVSIGDGPLDSIISFEVTVNSIILTKDDGGTVTVSNKPFRIELSHLSGTFVPIASIPVPQGTYTRATIAFSNVEFSIVNPDGTISEREPPLANASINVTLSPPLVVGASAMVLNLDFDIAHSIAFDSSGNPSVNPVVLVSTGAATPSRDDFDNGKIEDATGTVTTVGSDSFAMVVHTGSDPVTFKVNASTVFRHINGLSDLKPGMQVEVDARMQSDGTLLATKVEAEEAENEQEMREAMEVEGIIVDLAGSPVSQITVHAREVSSSMANAPQLGTNVDVSVSDNTKFEVRNRNVSLTSLPFTPVFSRATLSKGQNVEVDTDGLATSPVPARKLRLHEQTLTGTISGTQTSGGVTSFTITVPADSAFATLTGLTSVTAFQVSGTELKNVTSVTDGATLRVRGLLFLDGSTLKLVALRIVNP